MAMALWQMIGSESVRTPSISNITAGISDLLWELRKADYVVRRGDFKPTAAFTRDAPEYGEGSFLSPSEHANYEAMRSGHGSQGRSPTRGVRLFTHRVAGTCRRDGEPPREPGSAESAAGSALPAID
jgi:hypothetical protein